MIELPSTDHMTIAGLITLGLTAANLTVQDPNPTNKALYTIISATLFGFAYLFYDKNGQTAAQTP